MRKRNRKQSKKHLNMEHLPPQLRHVNLHAAGVDIGSDGHFVAVPEGSDEVTVREFGPFTSDLETIADWLEKCEVTTVAMESTGVYWIPLFELLEQRGFDVKLVDARHVKNVSGRKSDVLDCQWLQQLHTFGLLQGAFRPPDEICMLRSYVRQKEMLTQASSMHIQHIQKALQQMNLLLHNVVSDVTGVTGMKIIKAILAGERDPNTLAENRQDGCRNTKETIAKSLIGNFRDDHLFVLKQAVELYETYQAKIIDCEDQIARYLLSQPDITDDAPPPPAKLVRSRERIRGGLDVRDKFFKMTNIDMFAVPGLAADTLLTLASEVGFDMSSWKTVKQFTCWLGLCPGTKISGRKHLNRRTKHNPNRATQAFRIAASSLANSQTALGAFYRRIRARTGGKQAVTATAHKISRIYYTMLTKGTTYVEAGLEFYENMYKERRIKALKRQALALGFQLQPKTP